jgi:hypothetical protein
MNFSDDQPGEQNNRAATPFHHCLRAIANEYFFPSKESDYYLLIQHHNRRNDY